MIKIKESLLKATPDYIEEGRETVGKNLNT